MRKLLPIILLFGFIFPFQPANASVSCNSVKTNILKIEKKVLNELKYFKALPADAYGTIIIQLNSEDAYRMEAFGKATWLYDVWKLGTNNPKCFTNTQKIALKDAKFKIPDSYLSWSFYDSLQNLRLSFKVKYQSIYKY